MTNINVFLLISLFIYDFEIQNCGTDGKAILSLFPGKKIGRGELVPYFCRQLFLILSL